MRVGIAIDEWKLSIFERKLQQAGFAYEKGGGLMPDTLMLYVDTDNLHTLESVVRFANMEAAWSKAT
jgi:hypothetical protein